MSNRLQLRLDADLASLPILDEAVEEFGTAQDWALDMLFQVKLALEEVAVNVINHGYGEGGHAFEVDLTSEPGVLTIRITDEAQEFNPLTSSPAADVDASVDERRVGGLGLHLVRTMMDEMRYERVDGRNRLTLVKKRDE